MNVATLPVINSPPETGKQFAERLNKDFDNLQRTYNRHREKNTDLPPLIKQEVVSETTKEYIEGIYSGKNTEARQTPIRKIETPQYEPPIDKAKIEEELKIQFETERKRLKEETDRKLQREQQRTEQLKREQEAEKAKLKQDNDHQIQLEKEQTEQLKRKQEAEKAKLKQDNDHQIQQQQHRLEIEYQKKLQQRISEEVEAERERLKEQYAEKLAFTDEKVQLSVQSVRAKVELELRDELDSSMSRYAERTKRDLDREHQLRIDELQRQFDKELYEHRIKLTETHTAEVEAQKAKPFFEKKMFAVAVLLITMSVQMYEVGLFIQQTFHFADIYLSLFWAGAFQFGGLMMTIHIGNHEDFYRSFLFWFASLSVVIDLFVLLPESTGGWNIPARILFAIMFPLIEFAYGKIYLKLK